VAEWGRRHTECACYFAQDDVADDKAIQRIREEIELVPSLHARHQGAANLKGMPKFSAKKLAGYGADDAPADKERKRRAADKDKYAEDHPLRAVIFEAVEGMEEVQKLELRVALLGGAITPKIKAAMLEEQAPIGMSMFRLEQILGRMRKAEEQRGQEKSKRWLLNYDFARSRLEANLIFLYEYNFTLGTIRKDNLPDLRPGDAGWRITYHPNLHIPEPKAKRYAEDRAKRLSGFRAEHADTPWAFFADLEGGRLLGMEWSPAKE
jgi:hypothetical protein